MSDLNSVIREIRPCDDMAPYVFISYSSADKEIVWRDVLEFQKRGFNVWLDEKNLDKTKASWKEDALTAIEDMDCALLVFYVSKTSLRSEACFQELSKTVADSTRALHFGPVKFIAVDAEEVGDMKLFHQEVFNSIRNSDLDKEERRKQALALNGFMQQFFDSNNEKIRIHPKGEENRKMDYYEEILAAFPDETRIFDPMDRIQETAPLPAVEEKAAAEMAKPEERMLAEMAKPEERMLAEMAKPEERMAAEMAKPEERMAAEMAKPEERMAAEMAKPEERMAAEMAKPEEKMAAEMAKSEEKVPAEMGMAGEKPASTEAGCMPQIARPIEEVVPEPVSAPVEPEPKEPEEKATPEMAKSAERLGPEIVTAEEGPAAGIGKAAEGSEPETVTAEEKPSDEIGEAGEDPFLKDISTYAPGQISEEIMRIGGGDFSQDVSGKKLEPIPVPAYMPGGAEEIAIMEASVSKDGAEEAVADYFTHYEEPPQNISDGRLSFKKKDLAGAKRGNGNYQIEFGYKRIEPKFTGTLFGGRTDVVQMTLPDSLLELNPGEFKNCERLQTIKLPKYMKSVGIETFRGCSSLKYVEVPGNVTSIGFYAFANCSSLEGVKLPEGLKALDKYVFEACGQLKEMHLPQGLESIGSGCFKGCAALREILIPGSVKKLPAFLFSGCYGLRKVVIQEGVTELESLFGEQKMEMEVWIPDSVVKIDVMAFRPGAKVTIHCSQGSPAHEYAQRAGFPCVFETP